MNRIQFFMHSAVYLVATINCFAVLWVGFSSTIILSMRLLKILHAMAPPTKKRQCHFNDLFLIILWRLAPMGFFREKFFFSETREGTHNTRLVQIGSTLKLKTDPTNLRLLFKLHP